MHLPNDSIVSVSDLIQIFNRTTTSYKFLFFQALLQKMQQSGFQSETYSFDEIVKRMLKNAEFPAVACRLSFGVNDQVSAILKGELSADSLTKYVPYRLLTPFFQLELKGVKDAQKNARIELLSQTTNTAIYTIEDQTIKTSPKWLTYFQANYTLIEGWFFWCWGNYLQRRNPNAPAIFQKLVHPRERESLTKQRRLWKLFLSSQTVLCPYSHQPIDSNHFDLDHFLPWTFVGHNQLWNLIPTIPNINSAKSNHIPHADYFMGFIQCQRQFLIFLEDCDSNLYRNNIEEYTLGLQLSSTDVEVIGTEEFNEKYGKTLQPLYEMALNQGFSGPWKFESSGCFNNC